MSTIIETESASQLVVPDNRLEATIQQANLEPATAQGLLNAFKPLFSKAHEICATAANLIVSDATQVTEMKQARALRLALRAVRIEAEKMRKTMKEDSLRRGKAIDGVYNVLEYVVAPVESRMLEMEEFAERAEAARKAAAKASREELLKPFAIDTTFYQLGEMSEQAFSQLLDNTRTAHEAKIDAAKKEEADRIAREKAEAAERERIRIENERLKREAVEREAAAKAERERLAKERAEIEEKARKDRQAAEAKLAEERRVSEEKAAAERRRVEAEQKAASEKARIEREAVEAKAKAEREARQRLEAQERARKMAEEKRARDEADALARAAAAPDRQKIETVAKAIRELPLPEMATENGRAAILKVSALLRDCAQSVAAVSETLGK